jgi:hypothetical protein
MTVEIDYTSYREGWRVKISWITNCGVLPSKNYFHLPYIPFLSRVPKVSSNHNIIFKIKYLMICIRSEEGFLDESPFDLKTLEYKDMLFPHTPKIPWEISIKYSHSKRGGTC